MLLDGIGRPPRPPPCSFAVRLRLAGQRFGDRDLTLFCDVLQEALDRLRLQSWDVEAAVLVVDQSAQLESAGEGVCLELRASPP